MDYHGDSGDGGGHDDGGDGNDHDGGVDTQMLVNTMRIVQGAGYRVIL